MIRCFTFFAHFVLFLCARLFKIPSLFQAVGGFEWCYYRHSTRTILGIHACISQSRLKFLFIYFFQFLIALAGFRGLLCLLLTWLITTLSCWLFIVLDQITVTVTVTVTVAVTIQSQSHLSCVCACLCRPFWMSVCFASDKAGGGERNCQTRNLPVSDGLSLFRRKP